MGIWNCRPGSRLEKSTLSRLEALGSGRVVLIWGPSRILVGSFDCFQVDLFYMNVILPILHVRSRTCI